MKLISYISIILMLCMHSYAQNSKSGKTNLPKNITPVKDVKQQTIPRKNKINAVSCVVNGKVLIRWVPGSPALMLQGIKYGYKIERVSSERYKNLGSESFTAETVIISSSVLPVSVTDTLWKNYIRQNKNAALVYQYLFPPQKSGTNADSDVLFGFALKACEYDFELAQKSGLGFTDSLAKGSFAYRISLNKNDAAFKYEPAVFTINSNVATDFAFNGSLKAKSNASQITLSWDVTEQRKLFGAFNIERSENGTDFSRLNKAPVVFVTTEFEKDKKEITFIDTVKESGKRYYYRVKGISFFTFEGKPSETVSAAIKASLEGYPFIDSVKVINDKYSAIYFHHSPEIVKKEVKQIICFRSLKEAGPYSVVAVKISGQNNFSLIDEFPNSSNYYKIAYDLADGDTVWSPAAFIKIPDVIPPAIPVGLNGKIDSAGTVTLSWENNTDADLMGYRVFTSNSLAEEFVEISRKIIKTNSFSLKLDLKNLTEEIYYKITAVDQVYNNSRYSPVVKIKKPDRIAPVAAVITKLTHTDSTIDLEFVGSSSKDISKHIILRVNIKSNSYDTVMVTTSGEPKLKFFDKTADAGNTYQYEILAVDDDANISKVKSGHIVYQPKYFAAVKDIRAFADREKRMIIVEWNYPSADVYSFLVYKSKKGGKFKLIETVSPAQHKLLDKEVNVNNIYEYKIKAVLKSGSETKLSLPVEVNY